MLLWTLPVLNAKLNRVLLFIRFGLALLCKLFCEEVVADVSAVSGLVVAMDPLLRPLGICDTTDITPHKRLFILFVVYYTRKSILTKWKVSDPPTMQQWRSMVNKVLPLHRLKCEKKKLRSVLNNNNKKKNRLKLNHA